MGSLQPWHVIVIVIVAFVLFGAKRLPDATRSVGQSLRIFKSEMRESVEDAKQADKTVAGGEKDAAADRTNV